MSVICHIDGSEYESVADVHALLKSLRIKQAMYYEKHYPRACKGTGELIKYKDYKQYFAQDFKDKNALKAWVVANPVEGKAWAINWLKERKREKGLVYAPSQAELRSLQCPSMHYYESIGGYYTIARELGFIDRYSSDNLVKSSDLSRATLIQDSREQAPLKLAMKTMVEKVEVGDYALAVPHDLGIRIERKSLGDFVGTLNCRKVTRVRKETDSSFERFDRELQRAVEGGVYVVMLVEASLDVALAYDDPTSKYYVEAMKYSKAGPSHVFKNLRDLLTKYPLHLQVVFADGRIEAARLAMRIFELGEQVKKIDLQFALERRKL